MIDLRIGNLRLWYDGLQWTLVRITVVQKGDNIGRERETDYAYHGKLSHALLDAFDRLAGQDDAQSVERLLHVVQHTANTICEASAEVERQLLALRHGEG